ncbi:hypothetical protein BB561_005462 [Smittium simulii]|uniref:Reverse transcriptase RNase H-like domain-containing protein n=1 Tax=Smittium simulii TaxID=133385 RepID=A0A2T9YA98_9FUNG|nr:hypothetical protein BB561_005462 [Smittium simulii]
MQDDYAKRLNDISRPRERIYVHSGTPKMQKISLLSMGRKDLQLRALSFGLSLSSHRFTKMLRPYKENLTKVKPTGVQDQDGEIQHHTISIDYLSDNNDKLTKYGVKSPIRQDFGFKEKLLNKLRLCTATVTLNSPAIQNLEFWKQSLQKWKSLLFIPETPEMGIFINDSNMAWRIVVGSQSYSELRPLSMESVHINFKKLLAVYYALELCSVVERSVLVYSENNTTLAYVQKFGVATSPKLLEVLEKLWSHLKYNTTDSKKDSTRKNNNTNNNTNMEVSNLVSDSGKIQYIRAYTNTEF